MTGLSYIGQDDFAAGVLTSLGRDITPGIGVAYALNALFDDDGDAYRRGGTNYASVAADGPLTFLWTGFLADKAVGLAATATSIYSFDPTAVSPFALTKIASTGIPSPILPAVVGDLLFLPNGFVWGGTTKANYATGTIAVTQGQTHVVGTGTLFNANGAGGMLVTIAGKTYRVNRINSDTDLYLDRPVTSATAAGLAYTLTATATIVLPGYGTRHLGAVANRLLVGYANRVAFSGIDDPLTFDPTDYHQLPDGVVTTGLMGLRDLVLIFSAYGLWTIQNVALDLTDALGNPQQTLSRLTPELALLNEAGLCEYAGAIVVPCLDRIYLVDGLTAPTPISDSIAPDYMALIRSGARAGGAKVFRNHLFLPMLVNGTPSAVFVCRLNRPVRGRFTYYPFSTLGGHGAGMVFGDVSLLGLKPRMLVAHRDGRIAGFTNLFNPDATNSADADGTVHEFDLETRDFPTGNGQPNHTRKLRLVYTLEGNGDIEAGYSIGETSQTYQAVTDAGGSYADLNLRYASYTELLHGSGSDWISPADPERLWHVLGPLAPPSPGLDPAVWSLQYAARVRYIRARLRCADPVTRLVVHRVEFGVRPAAHQR